LALLGTVLSSFSPGAPLPGFNQNPLGIDGLPSARIVVRSVQTLLFALVLVSAASMFARLRRAGGVERQQIKGVAYAAAATASGFIVTYPLARVLIGAVWLEWAGYILMMAGVLGIPISMGIAILRYRLYNIDLIIHRTLVYGALTAILALVYFGSVTLLQYLLSLLTGEGNTLAIVASTLTIAALFNPLRRRIQGFIDRRFYRRKYDARKTLEAFGVKLRDETDLKSISEDLVGVVRETMQPSHVSLWLSTSPYSPKRTKSSSEARRSGAQGESLQK
jgi:hypothetical protein